MRTRCRWQANWLATGMHMFCHPSLSSLSIVRPSHPPTQHHSADRGNRVAAGGPRGGRCRGRLLHRLGARPPPAVPRRVQHRGQDAGGVTAAYTAPSSCFQPRGRRLQRGCASCWLPEGAACTLRPGHGQAALNRPLTEPATSCTPPGRSASMSCCRRSSSTRGLLSSASSSSATSPPSCCSASSAPSSPAASSRQVGADVQALFGQRAAHPASHKPQHQPSALAASAANAAASRGQTCAPRLPHAPQAARTSCRRWA